MSSRALAIRAWSRSNLFHIKGSVSHRESFIEDLLKRGGRDPINRDAHAEMGRGAVEDGGDVEHCMTMLTFKFAEDRPYRLTGATLESTIGALPLDVADERGHHRSSGGCGAEGVGVLPPSKNSLSKSSIVGGQTVELSLEPQPNNKSMGASSTMQSRFSPVDGGGAVDGGTIGADPVDVTEGSGSEEGLGVIVVHVKGWRPRSASGRAAEGGDEAGTRPPAEGSMTYE